MALVIMKIEDDDDSVNITTEFVEGQRENNPLTNSQALALELIWQAKNILMPIMYLPSAERSDALKQILDKKSADR